MVLGACPDYCAGCKGYWLQLCIRWASVFTCMFVWMYHHHNSCKSARVVCCVRHDDVELESKARGSVESLDAVGQGVEVLHIEPSRLVQPSEVVVSSTVCMEKPKPALSPYGQCCRELSCGVFFSEMFIISSTKEVVFSSAFVCVFVSRIVQKQVKRFFTNFVGKVAIWAMAETIGF